MHLAKALWIFAVVFALVLVSQPSYPQTNPRCRTISVQEAQERPEYVWGAVGTVGTALLLVAEREGKPVVMIGAGLMFLKEAFGLGKDLSFGSQLGSLNLKPNDSVQVCPVSSTLASFLGFKSLSVLGPPGVADKISTSDPPPDPPKTLAPPSTRNLNLDAGVLSPETRNLLNELRIYKNFGETGPLLVSPSAQAGSAREPRPPVKPPAFAPQNEAKPFDLPGMGALSAPLTGVRGTVRDGFSGQVLEGAMVRLTSSQSGNWWGAVTQDGRFEFQNVPNGDYLVSVYEPGYINSTLEVRLPADASREQVVRLFSQPQYPCSFTVINSTGWIVWGYVADGVAIAPAAQSSLLQPFSNAVLTLSRPTQLYVRADFSDAPSLFWGPFGMSCSGQNYAEILP